MGLFDSLSGIFSSAVGAVQSGLGGITSALAERAAGGTLRTTTRASVSRQLGVGLGNIFGDIAESAIRRDAPVMTGTESRGSPRQRAEAERITFGGGGVTRLGLVEPAADSLLGTLLPSLIPGIGGIAAQSFEGLLGLFPERRTPMPHLPAVAMPGGAGIRSPVSPIGGGGPLALPLSGRVYNHFQNLNTGAITSRARPMLVYMNPATGNLDIYLRATIARFSVKGTLVGGRRRHHHHPR